MARKPQVSWWKSRKAFGVWICGKQHILARGEKDDSPTGPVYLTAIRKFKEILELEQSDQAGGHNPVRVVLERYLCHLEGKRKGSTLHFRWKYLKQFSAAKDSSGRLLVDRAVADLKHSHIYAWLDEMRLPRTARPGRGHKAGREVHWGEGTCLNAVDSLIAAFNWAVRTGLIPSNPLVGIERPSARSRGREALLGETEDEVRRNHARILAAASPAFRPFVQALADTGARPSELAAATAQDVQGDCLVYYRDDTRREGEHRHKTARKKDRIILLTGETLENVRRLAEQYPTGPLFRTGRRSRGRGNGGWSDHQIVLQFLKLQEKTGLTELTAYSYRHQLATSWLKSGRSVDLLAAVLGNTPQVIRKHYAHLLGDRDGLRVELEAFRAASLSAGTDSPPAVLSFPQAAEA